MDKLNTFILHHVLKQLNTPKAFHFLQSCFLTTSFLLLMLVTTVDVQAQTDEFTIDSLEYEGGLINFDEDTTNSPKFDKAQIAELRKQMKASKKANQTKDLKAEIDSLNLEKLAVQSEEDDFKLVTPDVQSEIIKQLGVAAEEEEKIVNTPKIAKATPAVKTKIKLNKSASKPVLDKPVATKKPTKPTTSILESKIAEKKPAIVKNDNIKVKKTTSKPAPTTYEPAKTKRDIIARRKRIKPLSDERTFNNPDFIPNLTDNDYVMRLSNLPTAVPMHYNKQVRRFIDMYVLYKREQVQRMLARSDSYMTIFEESLNRHDLPMELKYIPVIESALIPHAKSKDGSTGLWQLDYGTGKQYGLEANSYIDERRDPVLATEAAVQHMKALYEKYNDWHLVIVAYNAGVGTVNKAIRRSGGSNNYWEIEQFLPEEVRAYVPLFIAANYVMNYYSDHNLVKYNPDWIFTATETVNIERNLNLQELSQFLNMDIEELQFLNPAILKNVIPKMPQGYEFTIPVTKTALLETYLGNLGAKNWDVVIDRTGDNLPDLPEDSPWNFFITDYNTVPKMQDRSSYKDLTPIKYTVIEGDVLSEISMLYDCSVNELKSWNHLNNDKINAGQRLTVYVARKYKKLYENIEASTQKEILKAPPSLALQNRTGSILPGQVQFRVKKGESLLQISEFFSGVSAEEIRQYNKLPSVNILTNQVITIPVPRSSSQSRSY